MRVELFGYQRPEHTSRGMVTGVDGRGYARVGTKMTRRKAAALVAAGVPLILDGYTVDREWVDGADALQVWEQLRRDVVSTVPTEKHPRRMTWTAGLWTSDDDRPLLYLIGEC